MNISPERGEETMVVEQHYQTVCKVFDSDTTITEVAKHYGVDRSTLHSWITRRATGGLAALVTQSTRPDTGPRQMDPIIEARLVDRRRMHPTWGPRTSATKLRAKLAERAPSHATIYRALVRHEPIIPVPRRCTKESYRRWELRKCYGALADGRRPSHLSHRRHELHCITGIGDHSRFCVSAKFVTHATTEREIEFPHGSGRQLTRSELCTIIFGYVKVF